MRKTCFLFAALLLPSSLLHAGWHESQGEAMGTSIRMEFYLPDTGAQESQQAQQLINGVMQEMHRIDAAFSPYKQDSELSRLNQQAPQGWVSVSNEMYLLLERSAAISRMTQGAFDVTYASVGRFYDYRKRVAPDDDTIDAAVQAIDYRHVELRRTDQGGEVRFAHPRVYVDLGGIAKGYAVDRAASWLAEQGVSQSSVSAGGDSRITGDRRGEPWTVGVKHPRVEGQMSAVLPLENTAVSTSGDYERFFEADGQRFHHILDPSTGRSADGAWSVTVLGPEAMFTDALSTSVFVLGPERGLALIDQFPGVDAIIINAQGKLLFSSDLAELQPPSP